MEKQIHLTVVTPTSTVLDTFVDSALLPGAKGAFAVLYSHAPLISSLDEGDIAWSVGENQEKLHILGGFVEVCDNTITVCAEL